MKLKFILTIAMSLCLAGLNAQIDIWSNPISGTNPNTANPFTTGQTVVAGITVSGIGRGAGATGTNANDRYNANSWNTASLDATAYFSFTITPNATNTLYLKSFSYTGQTSGTGPTQFALRSSVDGYTANIGSPTDTGTTIDLTAAAYQNLTAAITFRLYAWGTTNSGGTFSVNDFVFNGVIVSAAAEINIQQSTANYNTGSTYNFGTFPVGGSSQAVFTIQNFGVGSLNLGAATFNTGSGNFTYTTAYASSVGSYPATTTFVVTYNPVTVGLTTGANIGSISIPNNDATGGENPYVISFTGTGTAPAPEINVRGIVGSNPTIASGSVTPSGTNNTQFAAQNLGNSQTKTFRIENTGSANLSVSSIALTGANPGDFIVTSSAPYSISGPSGFIDFTITFQPVAIGLRTATVSISNNDSDENPYTFAIEGTGNCPANTLQFLPASGPVGTVVTINSTASIAGASVQFNGVAATVTQVSSNQITAVVPAGPTTGSAIVTSGVGCATSGLFTVINNDTSSCQGGSAVAGDLFISQVTDSGADALSYIEIFNGTGATVNLGSYRLELYNNGSTTNNGGAVNLNSVNLANNATYVVAIGTTSLSCTGTPGGNLEYANQVQPIGGINFKVTGSPDDDSNGHDHIRLFKSGVHIDSWGTYNDQSWAVPLNLQGEGANFERKATATVPSTAFSLADWIIADWGENCSDLDYSNVGVFSYSIGTPPTITAQPAFVPSCKEASFTVSATEGFAGGNALAYQWYVNAPNAATWTALTNAGVYSGATSPTLMISNISALAGYQYYCQVRENSATCYTASNAVMISGIQTVTWNGTAWSPASGPNATTPAVINGNYVTATHGSFDACSVTVLGTRNLTISPNTYVSIVNDLTVNAGGTLLVQDDGSLVMIEDSGVVTNNGSMQVARTTTPFNKYDYTYWTSPVVSTTLGAAFPGWRTDYSWSFNTANYSDVTGPNGSGPADGFDDNLDTWTFAGPGATMVPAAGYAVMAPTNLGAYPTTATVTFAGAVNNGVITVPLALSENAADNGDDYNLVGNPYPSAIFADDFINLNTDISGTLLFWTHSTPISGSAAGPYQSNFVTSDYAMYNLGGGVASSNGGAQPNGYVASGQGFFVEADAASNLTFNNSMRSKTYSNNNFYRPAHNATVTGEKDRVWLNFQHELGFFSQQLIVYTEAATPGIDRGYDGVVSNAGNTVSFYSFIGEGRYRIQGRPAFDSADVVPLGLSTGLAGTYTISIEHAEGILNTAAVSIYLEDKLLHVLHDLKLAPYTFQTGSGASDDRFQLRYETALGEEDHEPADTSVAIISNAESISVRAGFAVESVEIFNLLGQRLYGKNGIHSEEYYIPFSLKNQPLLVNVTLENGQNFVKKIMH